MDIRLTRAMALVPASRSGYTVVYNPGQSSSTGQTYDDSSAGSSDELFRGKVVRVRGLAPGNYNAIKQALCTYCYEKLGNKEYEVELSVVPSCNPKEPKLEALVAFKPLVNCVPKMPKFMLGSDRTLLERTVHRFNNQRIEFDAHFRGFTQLFQPQPPNLATADVIAVPGLDSHPYGSWTARDGLGEMWLRDFLHNDSPRFRTMIYGYHAKLSGHAGGTLEDYALQLLEDLKRVRSTEDIQRRPLFFVTHSLGGILVMRALVKAKQEQDSGDPAITNLYKAAYGFMFFAVPHGGIDFQDMTKELEKENHPLVSLLYDISKDSTVLKSLAGDFKNLIRHRRIFSFVEANAERSLQKKGNEWVRCGPLRQTLESDRSSLRLPSSMETPFTSFDKSHSTIVKLEPNDPEYAAAKRTFEEWERNAPAEVMNQFCT